MANSVNLIKSVGLLGVTFFATIAGSQVMAASGQASACHGLFIESTAAEFPRIGESVLGERAKVMKRIEEVNSLAQGILTELGKAQNDWVPLKAELIKRIVQTVRDKETSTLEAVLGAGRESTSEDPFLADFRYTLTQIPEFRELDTKSISAIWGRATRNVIEQTPAFGTEHVLYDALVEFTDNTSTTLKNKVANLKRLLRFKDQLSRINNQLLQMNMLKYEEIPSLSELEAHRAALINTINEAYQIPPEIVNGWIKASTAWQAAAKKSEGYDVLSQAQWDANLKFEKEIFPKLQEHLNGYGKVDRLEWLKIESSWQKALTPEEVGEMFKSLVNTIREMDEMQADVSRLNKVIEYYNSNP